MYGFKVIERPAKPEKKAKDRNELSDDASARSERSERKEKKEKREKKEKKARDQAERAQAVPASVSSLSGGDGAAGAVSPSIALRKVGVSKARHSHRSSSRRHRDEQPEAWSQEQFIMDLINSEMEKRQYGDVKTAEAIQRREALLLVVEEEEARARAIEEAMKKVEAAGERLAALLDTYDARAERIATGIAPVREKTQKLQLVNTNIDRTSSAITRILSMLDLAEVLEPKTQAGLKDVSEHLGYADQARDALALLESGRDYRSAASTVAKLRPIYAQLQVQLEPAFVRLLGKCSVAVEQAKLPATVEERPSIISSKRLEQLRRLISHLATRPESNYLAEYKEKRARFLVLTLKKLTAESAAEGDRAYAKGSHRLLSFLKALLQLLNHERWLAETLLPARSQETVLGEVVEEALELFAGSCELLTKGGDKNATLLPLLDVWGELNLRMPLFTRLLGGIGNGKPLRDVTDLHSRLAAASRKILTEYEDDIKKAFKAREMPPDGTVHELTANTLALMRRLLEYPDILEVLLKDTYLTKRGPIKEFYSGLLLELRTQLAEKAKKASKPVLGSLFLLNNYHQILLALRNTALKDLFSPAEVAEYEQQLSQAKSQYRHSWNKALEYVMEIKNWQNNSSGKTAVKNRFKGFNAEVEDLYNTQRHYAIPDPGLRNEIRADIKAVLQPLYENFLRKYENVDFSKNKGKYIKFSASTLASMVDRFFEDQAVAKRDSLATKLAGAGRSMASVTNTK